MDFENERYVRYYVRETTTFRLLRWEAQAVLPHVLRLVDRAGVFDLSGETPEHAFAAALPKWPVEVVGAGIRDMIARGILVETADAIVWPLYLEAQEAKQSDRQRQAESRARRRDLSRAEVTSRDTTVTPRDDLSRNVLERHARSHDVTPCRSSSAEPAEPTQPTTSLLEPPVREGGDRPNGVVVAVVESGAPHLGATGTGNGSGKRPTLDPELRDLLFSTEHLRSLAEPEHAAFWHRLEVAYDRPWLFFDEQVRAIDATIEARPPEKRPDPESLTAFVRNWFAREVEKGDPSTRTRSR